MLKKSFLFLCSFVVSALVAYGIHNLVFQLMGFDKTTFKYSLEMLYLGFSLVSLVILIVLLIISKRNMHIVGMVFMLLTTFKMMGCYVLADFILFKSKEITTEKWNFFALFMVFLFLETVFSIKILNPKKEGKS